MEGDDGKRERYQQAANDQGNFSGKARDPLNSRQRACLDRGAGVRNRAFLRFLQVLNKNAEFGNSAAHRRGPGSIFAPDSKPLV